MSPEEVLRPLRQGVFELALLFQQGGVGSLSCSAIRLNDSARRPSSSTAGRSTRRP